MDRRPRLGEIRGHDRRSRQRSLPLPRRLHLRIRQQKRRGQRRIWEIVSDIYVRPGLISVLTSKCSNADIYETGEPGYQDIEPELHPWRAAAWDLWLRFRERLVLPLSAGGEEEEEEYS